MGTPFAKYLLWDRVRVRPSCLDGLGEVELKINGVYRWGDFKTQGQKEKKKR